MPRGNHTVAARLHGPFRAGKDELRNRFGGAHFVQVVLIEAGEDRHGEDLHRPLLACRRLHHRAVAVDGQEVAPRLRTLATARRTVSGMSWNLRSANTLWPRSASHATSSKQPGALKSSRPTL